MKKICVLLFVFSLGCAKTSKVKKDTPALYTYDVKERIKELGIILAPQKLPKGIKIAMATTSNNLVYLSGNGPITPSGERIIGKVGVDLTVEEGYEAARITAINHLSILKEEIGDLNKVVRIVKVLGMVNSNSSFEDHPKVINGYSDVLVEIFGERGKHSRSAVGMASLPWNLACEVETIIEIQP